MFFKVKRNVVIFLGLMISLTGCVSTSSKPVAVSTRADVVTENSKVIIFPMLVSKKSGMEAANSEFSNPLVDALIGKDWADSLGMDNTIIIPKIAFDKIPQSYSVMEIFVSALDAISALENAKVIQDFASVITKEFGDGAFALALVKQNENDYKSSGKLQLNMGLFDTKKMTWKWTTSHSYEKSMVPMPYTKVLHDLVSESFAALKEKNSGKVR
jgi:hypothetical protein